MLKYVCLMLFLLLVACQSEEKPTVIVFTAAQRASIDTLAAQKMKQLLPQLDSECLANFDTVLRKSIDSIRSLRLRQIEQQMNQLKAKSEAVDSKKYTQ